MREFKGVREDLQNTFVCFKENTTFFFLRWIAFVRVGMLRRAKRKRFIYLFLSERRLSSALFRSVTKVWCVADLFQWLYYFQDWLEYKTAFWKSGSKRWG